MERILKRIARAASKLVGQGLNDQAIRVPNAYQGQIQRLFEGRLEAAALASARLVIEELTGQKSAADLEKKFLSLFEVAQAAIRSWIASYAAAKVVRILETTRLRIRNSIARGEEQNEPPRVLAKRITAETGGEIARSRAETIARTESLTAASVGADEAARSTGLVLDKRWVATEDMRTRPTHHKANDQLRALDQLFDVGGAKLRFPRDPNGPAKEVINCFPFDTEVEALPVAATRHWYEGDLIEIVTGNGNRLSATPNHPILTDTGWKPLRLISKGDRVISSLGTQIKVLTDPNVKNVNTSIGEVFNSSLDAGDLERVCASNVDFHGDRPSHDVDVVFINSELRGSFDAALSEHGSKLGLKTPDARQPALVGFGLPAHLSISNANFPALGIGGGSKSFSSHDVRVCHSDAHSLGSCSTADASLRKAFVDCPAVGESKLSSDGFDRLPADKPSDHIVPNNVSFLGMSQSNAVPTRARDASTFNMEMHRPDRDASFVRDLLERFAGTIVADEVASVSVRKVSCHVFNLEDIDGWYIAQRIIVHNCRCVVLYEPRLPK